MNSKDHKLVLLTLNNCYFSLLLLYIKSCVNTSSSHQTITKQYNRDKEENKNMKRQVCSSILLLGILFLVISIAESQTCKPSGKIRGRKPPPGQCNQENDSDCCVDGKLYTTYKCSPPVSSHTKAKLTVNSFEPGGDGGAPSECDNKYHSDKELVVALSTGWFNNKSRCLNYITIYGNGKSVKAKVVDECDSTMGCDSDHDYQPPCPNNIVDASKAVWNALGVSDPDDVGEMDIYWTDA